MSVESEFIQFSADKLLQLMSRIETCTAMLSPEQIWRRHSENENAVGNLLLHLDGNLRQWILHGMGNLPDLRDRDSEFAARAELVKGGAEPQKLVEKLRSTVEEVVALIRAMPEGRLLDRVRTQGYDTTVLASMYHVVEHFAGHAFQIMLLTKLFTSKDLGFYAHLRGAPAHPDPLPQTA